MYFCVTIPPTLGAVKGLFHKLRLSRIAHPRIRQEGSFSAHAHTHRTRSTALLRASLRASGLGAGEQLHAPVAPIVHEAPG